MDFQIKTKDKDGNVIFEGTATEQEASFIFNCGIGYLLMNGVVPMLKDSILHKYPGMEGDDEGFEIEGGETVQ